MAERDRLLRMKRAETLAVTAQGQAAAQELLHVVSDFLGGGTNGTHTRNDGETIRIDATDPLGTVGRLVQEDFCILTKEASEHVLSAAVLCFPAGWRLAEKLGRPLRRIHDPVESYDTQIARRVQRLFDGVQVGRPLWRYNALPYASPELFQPWGRSVPGGSFLRSERQTIFRLPQTGAVVFGIHTYVMRHP